MKSSRATTLLLAAVFSIIACGTALPGWAASRSIILATTTSTQDSGLLDLLIPFFEKDTGYQVKTIAVGSGQALKMGEKGEADVLLIHSPDAEKKFMADGFGTSRRLVMHNDFVIVGPPADPAKITSAAGAADALRRIAQSGCALCVPGRQFRDPCQGEVALEIGRHHCGRAEVVSADRPGHGADSERGSGEEGLRPDRPGDLSGAEGRTSG